MYYGDNKSPGHGLHETPKGGNIVLREAFEALHVRPHRRREVPPFFVFSRTGRSRDVRFEGLAAPGASGVTESEDLVAIWKTTGAERFQNYRAVFTILDAPSISRSWVNEVVAGRGSVAGGPRGLEGLGCRRKLHGTPASLMAQIQPAFFDPGTPASERKVYELLRDRLPAVGSFCILDGWLRPRRASIRVRTKARSTSSSSIPSGG